MTCFVWHWNKIARTWLFPVLTHTHILLLKMTCLTCHCVIKMTHHDQITLPDVANVANVADVGKQRSVFIWYHSKLLASYRQATYIADRTKWPLQWHHNGLDGVSNHQSHGCLLDRLFRRSSKKTSKLRFTGLCEGNSPVTRGFPSQRSSNTENVSIWWCHMISQQIIGFLMTSHVYCW